MDHMSREPLGRVLTLTSNYPRWVGDSTTPFVMHLAVDLAALGWEVDVLAPHDAGAARDETLSGVRVRRFRYMWPESAETLCYRGGALVNLRDSRSNLLKTPPFVLAELAATMRQMRSGYDIVHSHWLLPQGFVGTVASRLTKVPHVATIHGGDVFALDRGILRTFKRYALGGAAAVTVNSSATRSAVEDIQDRLREVHTIPMGVDTELATAPDVDTVATEQFVPDSLRLLYVGRLVEEKGVGDLIEAIDMLDGAPRVSAVIVGEGPERATFETAVRARDLHRLVKFVGWVQPSDVRAYMQAADIYVGPSRSAPDGWKEAYGLSFAEALAAGTPVIASRSGGIGDIVDDGVNGLLVDERAPSQIAEAIRSLGASSGTRRRFGEAGRAKAMQALSREASAEAFSSLFTSVTRRRR